MTSPLPRSLIAAAIAVLLAWMSMATDAFAPLLLFLIVVAAIAFASSYWLRPLYGAIAALVVMLVSPLLEADIGACLCAIALALIIGAAVRLVSNGMSGRKLLA
jgi:high-affinity K+ transport system ATPase subunit B